MRSVFAGIWILLSLGASAEEKPTAEKFVIHDPSTSPVVLEELIFRDPRPAGLFLHIQKGEDEASPTMTARSLLIICWMPSPEGKWNVYQISGVEGYHSRERVESFLKHYYQLPPFKGEETTNVIVTGNNWGAGMELTACLKQLSKEHHFDVFRADRGYFKEARLEKEPADRQEQIRKAFEASAPAEQPAESKKQ